MIVLSFCFFLLCFALIGIASMRHSKTDTADYLVAGRAVNPWLTACSSMATNNSGYAFIGLVGFAFRFGLQSLWLSVAWVLGDLLVWLFVHRRVRVRSGLLDARSVPALLAADKGGRVDPQLAAAAGAVTFIFLSVYAAAQLKAGGTALHSLFGWPLEYGAVLGAVIVVLYCFSGGLRASIWTDTAQAVVMVVGMSAVIGLSFHEIGGPTALAAALRAIDPALATLHPADATLGFPLYFLGFVAGGFGAIGAPHILIRSMALESAEKFQQTRRIYLASFIPFVLASAVIGLYARAIMPELAQLPAHLDPALAAQVLVQQSESALPAMAMKLLPNAMIGMILAAIFAATMSTADSQILSCSAAITQDMVPRWGKNYRAGKLATLAVASLALLIALLAGKGVFALVLVAWSALGAMLGPILLLRLANLPLSRNTALLMMAGGLITVVLWDRSAYAGAVFKLLPGLLVPALIYLVMRQIKKFRALTTAQASQAP